MKGFNPSTLPEGYAESFKLDLQKDRKTMLLVNGVALVLMLLFALLGHWIVPITTLFSMEQGMGMYFARFVTLIVGYVVYMVLHELVHGICMKYYSGVKPHYGFKGMYAFAGSNAYFCKKAYIIIALAPVVVWGVVLGALCAAVPQEWFWVVYCIQIGNLSGAAGDLFVSWRLSKEPKDILVNDTGVAMTIYAKTK